MVILCFRLCCSTLPSGDFRSFVNGQVINGCVPAVTGSKPRSDVMMAFHRSGVLSQGCHLSPEFSSSGDVAAREMHIAAVQSTRTCSSSWCARPNEFWPVHFAGSEALSAMNAEYLLISSIIIPAYHPGFTFIVNLL
jgi:hypothetical protein